MAEAGRTPINRHKKREREREKSISGFHREGGGGGGEGNERVGGYGWAMGRVEGKERG